ncbi:hypothetical protein VPNG_08465 [Cytospora leucostoma]|uniref:F-box domain-containing protein n=1 Tax=Cytospora leucostoma TaxID=1230097 RepID=A0A423WRK3_9PEZI|nr:hypothetical protein VPNG_08465 [Cytospora leucostoma]
MPLSSPEGHTSRLPSQLEALPVEIQLAILAEMTSLQTLRAIVHASPRFHLLYTRDRLSILKRFLGHSLDGTFADAHAAYLSRAHRPFPFDSYIENLATASAEPALEGLSLADATGMARFHLSVVEPLTRRYASWTLSALSSSPEAAPLRETEEARIKRAMYRLQVICNMPSGDASMLWDYLGSFPPWEVEQVLCVHAFARERYVGVFLEMASRDINQEDNVKYGSICDTSVDRPLYLLHRPVFLVSGGGVNEGSLAMLLKQGLEVLEMVFKAPDRDTLASLLEYHIGDGTIADDWVDLAMDNWEYATWVVYCKGLWSNYIGSLYIPNALRRWGHVMWDAKRLEGSGAMDYIESERDCLHRSKLTPDLLVKMLRLILPLRLARGEYPLSNLSRLIGPYVPGRTKTMKRVETRRDDT